MKAKLLCEGHCFLDVIPRSPLLIELEMSLEEEIGGDNCIEGAIFDKIVRLSRSDTLGKEKSTERYPR